MFMLFFLLLSLSVSLYAQEHESKRTCSNQGSYEQEEKEAAQILVSLGKSKNKENDGSEDGVLVLDQWGPKQCPSCDKRCQSSQSLIRHLERKHNVQAGRIVFQFLVKCLNPKCDYKQSGTSSTLITDRKKNLRTHMNSKQCSGTSQSPSEVMIKASEEKQKELLLNILEIKK